MLSRPNADEYFEYYGKYIALVPHGDVRDHMRAQLSATLALLSSVSEAQAEKAYDAGKWTLKEVVLHLADNERVFGYRMLRIARGDAMPLPGFEPDEWMPYACANTRTMPNLLRDFAAVRAATLSLLDSCPVEAFVRKGTAGGHAISVRALAYVTAGHERHHMAIIHERYLAT